MIRLNEEKTKSNDDSQEQTDDLVSMINMAMDKPEIRAIAIYGDINEDRCSEVVYGLLALDASSRTYMSTEEEDEPVEVVEPIDFYISSYGGQATEMFAVYDVMRDVGSRTPICTYGLGKVMSAGVLLLAAGTKGKRKIGKNCRIMMHSVIGGHSGNIHNLENEMEEVRWIQDQHIRCMVDETDMSEKYLRKLLGRKVNVYLNAEEAVELGIADEIF